MESLKNLITKVYNKESSGDFIDSTQMSNHRIKTTIKQGCVADWLVHRTHNPMIVGSSLTGDSNILGQDMHQVNSCPSRGRQV